MKEVVFEFPTDFEETGLEANELWEELMPRITSQQAATFREER
jgi:hypothetical protein